jgi:hypothetical protein
MAKSPASKTGKAPSTTAKAPRTAAKTSPKTRNRRSPAQLLADLQAARALIAEKMGSRLAKLEARIARVEARYDTQIRLAELTDGASLDDLQKQLEEAKHQQRLLRMALKTKR